jgi:hypothetical protein
MVLAKQLHNSDKTVQTLVSLYWFLCERIMEPGLERLQENILSEKNRVLNHPIYQELNSIQRLHTFMEYHVFAVWDFMTLLKRLQRELTGVELPWMPSPHPTLRRFVNEIVLGEESDTLPDGRSLSHFEMYVEAMQAAGADAGAITNLLAMIKGGHSWKKALDEAQLPSAVVDFVGFHLGLAESAPVHAVASAFTFGREDLIPDMFLPLLNSLQHNHSELASLIYYTERHIELDGDDHGPLSLQLMQELCGNDSKKWEEAEAVAIQSLELRHALWSAVLDTF